MQTRHTREDDLAVVTEVALRPGRSTTILSYQIPEMYRAISTMVQFDEDEQCRPGRDKRTPVHPVSTEKLDSSVASDKCLQQLVTTFLGETRCPTVERDNCVLCGAWIDASKRTAKGVGVLTKHDHGVQGSRDVVMARVPPSEQEMPILAVAVPSATRKGRDRVCPEWQSRCWLSRLNTLPLFLHPGRGMAPHPVSAQLSSAPGESAPKYPSKRGFQLPFPPRTGPASPCGDASGIALCPSGRHILPHLHTPSPVGWGERSFARHERLWHILTSSSLSSDQIFFPSKHLICGAEYHLRIIPICSLTIQSIYSSSLYPSSAFL